MTPDGKRDEINIDNIALSDVSKRLIDLSKLSSKIENSRPSRAEFVIARNMCEDIKRLAEMYRKRLVNYEQQFRK